MDKLCNYYYCKNKAKYGECYNNPIRCLTHKENYKYVNILCQKDNCKSISYFNYEEEQKPKYCISHKNEYMIYIKYNRCKFKLCHIQPSFNYPDQPALYCKYHKLTDMIDVTNKTCEYDGCNEKANYNYKDEMIKKFCVSHKLDNMIEILYQLKYCEHDSCKIKPSFNFKDQTIRRFCKLHKLNNMVDLSHKICEYNECNEKANYNYLGKNPKFCKSHKLDNMVNIYYKYCEYDGCNKLPYYNYKDEKPIFCKTHKLNEMINVCNKYCEYDGCNKLPSYNYEGKTKGIFCKSHKLNEMINVCNKHCEYNGCNIRSTYNYIGEKPRFCVTHKLENMINVIGKICKSNLCLGTFGNPKYNGYCTRCFQHLFPNDPLTLQIRLKTKEIAVRDFINQNFEGFQHDIPLWIGNCECVHKRRIDHRKLIGNTLLCIETDENQHLDYDESDENLRYDDLFMIHGGKFIFIRFNPDKYKNDKGKFVNPLLSLRLPVLQNEIQKQIDRINNEENIELLEIIKLYYNDKPKINNTLNLDDKPIINNTLIFNDKPIINNTLIFNDSFINKIDNLILANKNKRKFIITKYEEI